MYKLRPEQDYATGTSQPQWSLHIDKTPRWSGPARILLLVIGSLFSWAVVLSTSLVIARFL